MSPAAAIRRRPPLAPSAALDMLTDYPSRAADNRQRTSEIADRRVDARSVTERLIDTLKRAVAALEAADITYLLGGGLGCWARGGPPSSNDIDLMVRREDA